MLPDLDQKLTDGLNHHPTGAPWSFLQKEGQSSHVYVWIANKPQPTEDDVTRCYRLTPTQARVALMLANRRTNAEIAKLLGITVHTARRHVEAVLLRMDARSRWEIEELVYTAAAGSATDHSRGA